MWIWVIKYLSVISHKKKLVCDDFSKKNSDIIPSNFILNSLKTISCLHVALSLLVEKKKHVSHSNWNYM